MDWTSVLATVALAAIVGAAGCRPPVKHHVVDGEVIEHWADLSGVRASRDPDLRVELQRVIDAHGTPRQLQQPPLAPDENLAVALAKIFSPAPSESVLARANQLFPRGAFHFNPVVLQEAIAFRRPFDAKLKALPEILRRRGCRFPVDFRRGFFADTSFLDTTTLAIRLEAFRVAELLSQDRPAEAIEPLRVMFRLVTLLASTNLVSARLAAVHLRTDTWHVLAACVDHAGMTRGDLRTLSGLVHNQLLAWPDDAAAWIGDRAIVLHSYEAIRAGHLDLLLTADERQSFDEEGVLRGLSKRLKASIDQDERFYLEAMRTIIASCAKPYYQRRQALTQIRRKLHALRNRADFPFLAGRLFLADIDAGHQLQARDRARCEAWDIALALAAGFERPAYRVNPLTGVAYAVDIQPDRVVVWGGAEEEGDVIVRRPQRNRR